MSALGEMHIRRGCYIGVAPLPGGIVNVCLVRPSQPADSALRDAGALLRGELAGDPLLADRFVDARLVAPPVVLGPLAVDRVGPSMRGLLLAGDAAGFVDPMTGDGLRFAVRGGEMAADAAREVLEHGWAEVHARLGSASRREFAAKWRFNRALRALVASPAAVRIGGALASAAPVVVRRIVRRAGDCHFARTS
jgi:flavin-dependent dehydrogenase